MQVVALAQGGEEQNGRTGGGYKQGMTRTYAVLRPISEGIGRTCPPTPKELVMIEHAESAEPSLPGNPYEVSRRDLLAAGTALGAAAAFGGTTRASAVTIISDRSYEAYNDPTKPLKNPERGIYASVQPKVATDYHTLVVKYLEFFTRLWCPVQSQQQYRC